MTATTTTATTTSARRGRPRDPARDRAILEAARRVLAERGYTGASMEAIARSAGVGKDTLYRRWDSKESLVRALLTVMAEEHVPVPADEDPAYALFHFLHDIVRVNVDAGLVAIVAGIAGEAARNPALAADFRDFWAERRRVAAPLVRAVVGVDVDDDQLERLLDRVLAPIYYRLLLTGVPHADEELWQLVLELLPTQTGDAHHGS